MFRFTIRDILWLTVLVGMGCAWYTSNKLMWLLIDRSRTEACVNLVALNDLRQQIEGAKRRGLTASEIIGAKGWDDTRRYTKADYRQHVWPAEANRYISELE